MASATVQPALIIGLGGSGIDIVRRFKRRFSTLYPDTPYVKLLGIDTAPQTTSTYAVPQLTDDEFVQASRFDMTHFVGPSSLDDNPEIRSWWRGYDSLPLRAISVGAGQRRPVGRLALFVRYHAIAERLHRDVREIFNDRHFAALPSEYKQLINIYVVASTCGGTGTGMFLDLAYITREIVRRSMPGVSPRVRAILLLPSVFIETGAVPGEQNRSHLRSNAYGALTELDYAMSASAKLDPITYPDGRRVSRDEPPFKGCYLVGNQTSDGAVITDIDQVLEKSATHLMIELASPLSSTGDAILDNVIDRIATNGSSKGRPRLYSSFTGDWLELPSAQVISRWTKRYSLLLLERLGGNGSKQDGSSPIEQLRLTEGYGTLRDLVSGNGLRRFEPRVEGALNAFLDIQEGGETAQGLIQRAQTLQEDAVRQIRGNRAFDALAEGAADGLYGEIETQSRLTLADASLGGARAMLTEVLAELETWLSRSRERSSVSPDHWLAEFTRKAHELQKGLLQSKSQFARTQRELVIDAAEAARRGWSEQLKAQVGRALEDRLPAVLTQVRQLRERLEMLQVAVDGAAAIVARQADIAIDPAAPGLRAAARDIDEALDARVEALDVVARDPLQDLLNASTDAERFAEAVWAVAGHAVRTVAPEYLRRLQIPTLTISDRINRLSPLAVFTRDWSSTSDSHSVERLCLVGLPESMNDREDEVKSGVEAEKRSEVQIVVHGDDERVVLTMQHHGFPLYALAEIEQCLHAFTHSDAMTQPLRFLLSEPEARSWSMLPLDAQASRNFFALGLALGWIRHAGQDYLYRENGSGAEIRLGSGQVPVEARQRARDEFLKVGLSSKVKAHIDDRVRREGNDSLYQELGAWLERQDGLASDPEYPREFRADAELVREYRKSIRPF